MLTIRPPKPYDCTSLAATLRQADVDEIKAATGSTPVAALQCGLDTSLLCRTIVDEDDTPVAMFGLHEYAVQVHSVWMLASVAIQKHRLSFLRQSRTVVDAIAAKYPGKLCNFVDSRNTLHHTWLKWCGFTIHPEHSVVMRDDSVPFYYFERNN